MIRTNRAHLNVVAHTHAGMTGKNNEDRYAVTSFQLSKDDATPVLFAVVADGIGGHRAGEVAAELAVNHISQIVAHSDGCNPKEILRRAIYEASEAIADHAAAAPEKHGMGATCACVWIIGNKLYTTSIGDSRIYLLREENIQQLTVDHTWIQEALDDGILTPENAHDHPNVHVIHRYLGSPEPPEVDFRLRLYDSQGDAITEDNQGTPLNPGDTLLLCSDGLTDLVRDDEIAEILRANDSLKAAAHALVDAANRHGGYDNTTVVLITVPRVIKRKEHQGKVWLPWILGGTVTLLGLIALASFLVFSLLRPLPLPTSTPTLTATPIPTITITRTITPTFTATTTATSRPPDATYTPWSTNTVPLPPEIQTSSP